MGFRYYMLGTVYQLDKITQENIIGIDVMDIKMGTIKYYDLRAVEIDQLEEKSIVNIDFVGGKVIPKFGNIEDYRIRVWNEYTMNGDLVFVVGVNKSNDCYKVIKLEDKSITWIERRELLELLSSADGGVLNAELKDGQIELSDCVNSELTSDDLGNEIISYINKVELLGMSFLEFDVIKEGVVARVNADKFKGLRMKDMIIPEGVDILLAQCTNDLLINRLYLPKTLKEIQNMAFLGSHAKETIINIGENLNFEKNNRCFMMYYTDKLTISTKTGKIPDKLLDSITTDEINVVGEIDDIGKGNLITVSGNDLSHITIKKIIDSSIRFDNRSKAQIKLPNGLEVLAGSIREKAENGGASYYSFETLEIPNTIKEIGSRALKFKVNTLIIRHNFKLNSYAFTECEINNLIIDCDFDIIPDLAFFNCGLKNVSILGKVGSLGYKAFSDSVRKTNAKIVMNEMPTMIERDALDNCDINTFRLADGVELNNKLSNRPVVNNSNIGYVYIDCEITNKSVVGNSNIELLELHSDFDRHYFTLPSCNVKALKLSGKAGYIKEQPIIDSIETIDLGNNITNIAERSFVKNKIKELFIPKSVKYIGEKAFAFNEIEKLTFESGCKAKIAESAFQNNKISVVNIRSGMEVAKHAFDNAVIILEEQ